MIFDFSIQFRTDQFDGSSAIKSEERKSYALQVNFRSVNRTDPGTPVW